MEKTLDGCALLLKDGVATEAARSLSGDRAGNETASYAGATDTRAIAPLRRVSAMA
jgi:hypothetical protein